MSERNIQHAETTLQPAPPVQSIPSDEWKGLVIARLEEAAEAGNPSDFATALQGLEGEYLSAEEFIRLIRLALEAGAHVTARELSLMGASFYPSDSELSKYARVLAPPKFLGLSPATGAGIAANREWMKLHGKEYRGQWVAILDGQLLGAAPSLDELTRRLGESKNALLTIAYGLRGASIVFFLI